MAQAEWECAALAGLVLQQQEETQRQRELLLQQQLQNQRYQEQLQQRLQLLMLQQQEQQQQQQQPRHMYVASPAPAHTPFFAHPRLQGQPPFAVPQAPVPSLAAVVAALCAAEALNRQLQADVRALQQEKAQLIKVASDHERTSTLCLDKREGLKRENEHRMELLQKQKKKTATVQGELEACQLKWRALKEKVVELEGRLAEEKAAKNEAFRRERAANKANAALQAEVADGQARLAAAKITHAALSNVLAGRVAAEAVEARSCEAALRAEAQAGADACRAQVDALLGALSSANDCLAGIQAQRREESEAGAAKVLVLQASNAALKRDLAAAVAEVAALRGQQLASAQAASSKMEEASSGKLSHEARKAEAHEQAVMRGVMEESATAVAFVQARRTATFPQLITASSRAVYECS